MTTETALSLSQYLSIVKDSVDTAFATPTWVKAEIRNIATKKGHTYLELAEKDEDTDQLLATCKGIIWSFNSSIVMKFESATKHRLNTGMTVLISVSATFTPQWGFSLIVKDIDPAFTIGAFAQRFDTIVNDLTKNGLINKNKELPTPFDIHNVLVISPSSGAGLGDFQRDADVLEKYGVCNFYYETAQFQNTTAPQSIMDCMRQSLLKWAENHSTPPDLLVIIRGGGAVTDLAYLNDYALAAMICNRKIPVWVGIGHARDNTILDVVANRSFDTPSKVIAGICGHIIHVAALTHRHAEDIDRFATSVIQRKKTAAKAYATAITAQSRGVVKQHKQMVDLTLKSLKNNAFSLIKNQQRQAESLLRETMVQHPKTTLDKGFAIVRNNKGKTIKSLQQLPANTKTIQIEFCDGIQTLDIKKVG